MLFVNFCYLNHPMDDIRLSEAEKTKVIDF
jgi:hypothetical protein